VEALATLTDLTWTCVCAGALSRAPAYVARLRERIARLGLQGRVRLTGPQTGERLASSYAVADLVVLASRAETYGMVVTEALARGIPVMATAVGGVPDTLGGGSDGDLPGMLLPAGDAPALAEALRHWLGEPATRDRLRTAARHRREELDGWETTSRLLDGVLERMGREP
jgi:glycosyltransferase involved in cell wall biosynthesis